MPVEQVRTMDVCGNKSSNLVKLPQHLLPPSRFVRALIETRLDQKLQISNRKNCNYIVQISVGQRIEKILET